MIKTKILKNKNQEYNIFESSEENEVEIIQKLIKSGTDVNSTDEQKNTALHFSAMKGSLEATQRLLELGAKVDIKNEDDETPLHLVAKLNEECKEDAVLKISTALLEKGINPNVQDELGNTALHYAALNGNLELLKILHKYKGMF